MQLHATVIVELLKSAELDQAKAELETFKSNYPNKDLFLDNGASLVDSLDLLVGNVPPSEAERDSLLNAHPVLKAEIRRQTYWEYN
jgi:hypothetical protein